MPPCVFTLAHRGTWKHTRACTLTNRAIGLSFLLSFLSGSFSLSSCCFLSQLFLLFLPCSRNPCSSKGRLFSACCSLGSKWLWMQIRFKNRHTHTHTHTHRACTSPGALEKDECGSRSCGRGREGKSNGEKF